MKFLEVRANKHLGAAFQSKMRSWIDEYFEIQTDTVPLFL